MTLTTEERCRMETVRGEPCTNRRVADGPWCSEHGCGSCGGVMLADTEDWPVHWCPDCLGVNLVDVVEWITMQAAAYSIDDPKTKAQFHAAWKILQGLKSGAFKVPHR